MRWWSVWFLVRVLSFLASAPVIGQMDRTYRFVGCGGIDGCNKTLIHLLSLMFAVTRHLYDQKKLMVVIVMVTTGQLSVGVNCPEIVVLQRSCWSMSVEKYDDYTLPI